jgi:hypothetical protein
MLTVEVRDDQGRSMPFADVELRCSDGNSLKLRTVADGKVVFFPELDRLSRDVWVRATGSQWRKLRVSNEAGSQSVTIQSTAPTPIVSKLDLALVIDVTGSMSDELRYLQAELGSIVSDLKARHSGLDIRVGLIRAANQDWRKDAVKTLILVADAPPHNDDVALAWRAAEHLRNARVHIVPVGASGVGDRAEYVMRAMAAVTQSRYTFLTEDSGIGNPKAPPAIDCYLVTRLDQLLRRVIDSQISGRCILPPDFGKSS